MDNNQYIEILKKKAEDLLVGVHPSNPPTVFDKYLKIDFEVPYKYEMIEALGLERCEPESILDISTCFGWMTWILKELGHNLVYTDSLCFSAPIVETVRQRLNLTGCIDFAYEQMPEYANPAKFKFKPLPFAHTFDVIMANSVQPHGYFTPKMWEEFIDDCFTKLEVGGYIYISPNHSIGWDALDYVLKDCYNSEVVLQGWKIWK